MKIVFGRDTNDVDILDDYGRKLNTAIKISISISKLGRQ